MSWLDDDDDIAPVTERAEPQQPHTVVSSQVEVPLLGTHNNATTLPAGTTNITLHANPIVSLDSLRKRLASIEIEHEQIQRNTESNAKVTIAASRQFLAEARCQMMSSFSQWLTVCRSLELQWLRRCGREVPVRDSASRARAAEVRNEKALSTLEASLSEAQVKLVRSQEAVRLITEQDEVDSLPTKLALDADPNTKIDYAVRAVLSKAAHRKQTLIRSAGGLVRSLSTQVSDTFWNTRTEGRAEERYARAMALQAHVAAATEKTLSSIESLRVKRESKISAVIQDLRVLTSNLQERVSAWYAVFIEGSEKLMSAMDSSHTRQRDAAKQRIHALHQRLTEDNARQHAADAENVLKRGKSEIEHMRRLHNLGDSAATPVRGRSSDPTPPPKIRFDMPKLLPSADIPTLVAPRRRSDALTTLKLPLQGVFTSLSGLQETQAALQQMLETIIVSATNSLDHARAATIAVPYEKVVLEQQKWSHELRSMYGNANEPREIERDTFESAIAAVKAVQGFGRVSSLTHDVEPPIANLGSACHEVCQQFEQLHRTVVQLVALSDTVAVEIGSASAEKANIEADVKRLHDYAANISESKRQVDDEAKQTDAAYRRQLETLNMALEARDKVALRTAVVATSVSLSSGALDSTTSAVPRSVDTLASTSLRRAPHSIYSADVSTPN